MHMDLSPIRNPNPLQATGRSSRMILHMQETPMHRRNITPLHLKEADTTTTAVMLLHRLGEKDTVSTLEVQA